MRQKTLFATLLFGMTLVACEQHQSSRETVAPKRIGQSAAETIPAGDTSRPSVTANGASGIEAMEPDLTPPQLAGEAERGIKGARNVLLSFASAIEQNRYEQAWALLSPADQKKWNRAAFAAIFADLGKSTVAIPIGTIEGAVGSIYYTAPIAITSSDKNGRPVRIEGQAVLRRINAVAGANRSQLRWHFVTLTLAWVH